jgi:hypothetical protein
MFRFAMHTAALLGMTLVVQGLLPTVAASFTDSQAGLPRLYMSSVAWGDYDNDGDLDILLTGWTGSGSISRVYENSGGSFADINAGLPGVYRSSVAWGDYDNDGDLDILLTGSYLGRIYANHDGIFTDINAGLPGVNLSSAAWGDYDNDGDLDILLTGWSDRGIVSRIYANNGGTFADVNAGLPGVYRSSVAWGDYDNDGDLDVLLTGQTGTSYISRIFQNNAGVFTDINAGLPGVDFSSVAWGDFDNDGDLDLLLTGYTGGSYISCIYKNNAGVFADIGAGIPGVEVSSVAWGDADNDGDLDILLTGTSFGGPISCVYQNNAGLFTDVNAGLPGVHSSSVAWGDYDNDGDLDILLTGATATGGDWVGSIYANNALVHNTAPASPAGLGATWTGSTLSLSWGAATDAQTPASGLSYNLRVGTTPGGAEIVSAMSASSSGSRRVVQLGNTHQNRSWTLHGSLLAVADSLYWTVQAVDAGFMGSPFAAERRVARIPTGVEVTPLPSVFALRPNVPNPFNPWTTITYDLPAASQVHIEIFDAVGRRVRRLLAAPIPAGRHSLQWDGKNDFGERVASGVYVCRMQAGTFVGTRRMTFLK